MRHQFITLMTLLGTIGLPGYLYVIIPKGFFPQQDTGFIFGITEASQDISFPAMSERQQAVVDTVLQDPAIASVGSFMGPRGSTPTLNNGRIFISLKPKGERTASADDVINRLRSRLAKIQGIALYMQAAQDITIGGAAFENAVSIYACRRRPRRTQSLVVDLPRQAEEHSRHCRRRQRPAERGPSARYHDKSRCCFEPRNPARDHRQYALRRVRSAHRFDHTHPAEPVSRGA